MEDRSAHDPYAPKSAVAPQARGVQPTFLRRLKRLGISQMALSEAQRRWNELGEQERAESNQGFLEATDDEIREAIAQMEAELAAEDAANAEQATAICGYTETDGEGNAWVCRKDPDHEGGHVLEEFTDAPESLTGVVEVPPGEEGEVTGDGSGDALPPIENPHLSDEARKLIEDSVAVLTNSDGTKADVQEGGNVEDAKPEPVYQVPKDGTVDEVLQYVGEDIGRAHAALRVEKSKPKKDRRKTLIEALGKLTDE